MDSYEKYGKDVRAGTAGPSTRSFGLGGAGSIPGRGNSFIPDGTGRIGRVVKSPKGGLKFKGPRPDQVKAPMPSGFMEKTRERENFSSDAALNKQGWFKINGKWEKII